MQITYQSINSRCKNKLQVQNKYKNKIYAIYFFFINNYSDVEVVKQMKLMNSYNTKCTV